METPRKFIIAELSIRKLGSSSVLIISIIIISIISARKSASKTILPESSFRQQQWLEVDQFPVYDSMIPIYRGKVYIV